MNLHEIKEYIVIHKSELFDSTYYLSLYPDVRKADINPLMHYIRYGWKENRNPSSYFNGNSYLDNYNDVRLANINPLFHYIKYGRKEERCTFGERQSTNKNNQIPSTLKENSIITPYIHLIKKLFSRNGVNKLVLIIKKEGVSGLRNRANTILKDKNNGIPYKISDVESEYQKNVRNNIVQFYLDPLFEIPENISTVKRKVAVCIHIYYLDMVEKIIKYLKNIPYRFDLFISTKEKNDLAQISNLFKSRLEFVDQIIIKQVPNRGRDIAPFIIEFGQELLKYDVIGKFHTKKSPHIASLNSWFEEIMESLLGSPEKISQIFELFSEDAKFVYPAPNENYIIDQTGWGKNYAIAKNALKKYFHLDIQNHLFIEFPQGSMFWAKRNALEKILKTKIRYTDFPKEPSKPDGTLMHFFERSFFIAASKVRGRNYCINRPDVVWKEPCYEIQNNYHEKTTHSNIKILSYYLPQFYPIPENDLWHGKNFTEWNKVRSTNPLFWRHYQQRTPHSDIGYYSLMTVETLKKQASMMKKAGICGQIFYHYWFDGKLILENPAKMLLSANDIEMPFCFCWANENWTKKWDGNEREILLAQNYSEQDAINFINYLLPFFKDPRYIRIENRPILFVYRASSFPDFSIYKTLWNKICAENEIDPPYLVTVLTRGANSPIEFDMDAGAERVLHDWTNGGAKEIKNTLHSYWPVNGSVLDYNDVVDYYINYDPPKEFPFFRSLVPSWDNTPRYGSNALIVHNASPEAFQRWLEHLIVDTETRLPTDKQFILINAWNEWAESAYLEPDSRYGYAYLNSVGRALSGQDFNEKEYLKLSDVNEVRIRISLDKKFFENLENNYCEREKFIFCLEKSTILRKYCVFFEQDAVASWIRGENFLNKIPLDECFDYTFTFNNLCYFYKDTLEIMLKMAIQYDAGIISPSHLNDKTFTHNHLQERWEVRQTSPYLTLTKNGKKRSIKCCVDAGIFVSDFSFSNKEKEKVTTIVRFCTGQNLFLLRNALFSLAVQVDCSVQPILALQDLTHEELKAINQLTKEIPWDLNCCPRIINYYSGEKKRDMRSILLNESLKKVKTQYAAFLDYDDIVFHDAYTWLLQRLKLTNKNASFGLIYSTHYDMKKKRIVSRKAVYIYGKTYSDFFNNNHSPIHGYMLDLSKIDLENIKYYDDMKYMEDYYLNLQIFTEDDTDWKSLQQNHFVGDYYHFLGNKQTLAIIDEKEKTDILNQIDYQTCQERINILREQIKTESIK